MSSFPPQLPSCEDLRFMEMDDDRSDSSTSQKVDPRWYFDFEAWQPTEEEWAKCLSLVPAEERERIGRLMLRKAAAENMGVLPSKQVWRRTTEGKPFLLHSVDSLDTYTSMSDGKVRAGYNLNVSHDGKLVAFVGGSTWVIGVDVMCNTPSNPMPWEEFHPLFEENFTSLEWKVIHGGANESQHFEKFMHHWTLKESYIKSIGIGLGFELQRAEFSLDDNNAPTKAEVKIDGKDVDWFFEVHTNVQNHTISVSYGLVEDSIPSVQASIKYPGAAKPSDPFPKPQRIAFRALSIQDLLLTYE